ncbi:MAG: hypothetical protein LRY71_15020 [Bacillaceae bacterium]|nr:hypothetical protein [Bacillaceae bacterium]
MFQASMIQTLLNGLKPISTRNSHLRPGQLFQGEIIKLYPDQMASLKLGNTMLTARLEAPLIVGEKYWFEVLPGGDLPNLKVVEQAKNNENGHGNLIKRLGLKPHKGNDLLLKHLIRNNVPLRKSIL